MNAVVLYESLFGNTAAVARAIADGLGPIGEVAVARFGEVPDGVAEEADLLVLGGPTHAWGMTRPRTRENPKAEGYAVGAREWLEGIRLAQRWMAAAFDTRFDRPRWLTGSAARRIARRLKASGYRLMLPPESFFVEHTEGPLRVGEEDRARAWGAELARRSAGGQWAQRSETQAGGIERWHPTQAEAFGHPSLLSGLGPTFEVRAHEDTLCYQVRLGDAQATAKGERPPDPRQRCPWAIGPIGWGPSDTGEHPGRRGT